MKKIAFMLTAAVLLVGSAGQVASATVSSAAVVKQAFPDDPDFQAGLADGKALGAYLGKGNPAVSAEIQDAVANQQAASAAGDTGGANYWWGYRVGLNMYK